MENDEIVDERTGEIIPKGSPNTLAPTNALQVHVNVGTVGTLELSPETEEVLAEPLKEEEVKIRPDGLVYLPWTWYADRLNRAFGQLKWGLVPQGAPQSKDTGNNNVLVIWGNWLIIKGVPVGFAVGETSYRTNNNTMSYADAIEGAKSISLARNCKILGMSPQLWDAEWCATWKKKYAEQYDNGNGKTLWRKKSVKAAKLESKKPETVKADVQANEQADENIDTVFPPKSHTNAQLRTLPVVKEIAGLSGKKDSEVAVFVGKLDKSESYTVTQVVELMKEEK